MHGIRDELKLSMFQHFGVFREQKSMEEGLGKLRALKERFRNASVGNAGTEFNFALQHFLELEFLLDLAEPVALGALERKESRGSHERLDHTSRDDDNFLQHSMTYLREEETVLEYAPVTLGKFPVKERVY